MPVTIEVWSDFVCPFCFVVTLNLNRLRQEAGVEVRFRSFQLRRADAPPMPPSMRAMVAQEHHRVATVVREKFGVVLHPGPIGISTRLAHLAAKFAEMQGAGGAFHAAAMKAYWLYGKSLDDRVALERLAGGIGLDGGKLALRWSDSQLISAVEADQSLAAESGIRAVPALLFGGRRVVNGAQPYAVLRQALEETEEAARIA